MSLSSESKHFEDYYDHVLNEKKAVGTIAKVYNIINDLSGRRGIKHEWDGIDGDIQDEIIEIWVKIIESD